MDHEAEKALLAAVVRTERKVNVLGDMLFTVLFFGELALFFFLGLPHLGEILSGAVAFLIAGITAYAYRSRFERDVL